MKIRMAIGAALFVIFAGTGVAVWYFYFRLPHYDFDKLGGTVLVYEIAPHPQDGAPEPDAKAMAEALQRRLDPDGRGYAQVSAVSKDRVEIRVTKTGEAHWTVEHVKDLISRIGSLEFRMLANDYDDRAVVGARQGEGDARRAINDAVFNPSSMKELENAQLKGLPPPGPREVRNGESSPKKYEIVTFNNAKSTVSYSWVELSPHERRALNLDNAAEKDPTRNAAWLVAKAHRNKAVQLPEAHNKDWLLLQGALFYSRECKNVDLPDEERKKKAVEYFVLTRDPEYRDDGPRTPKLDGSYLVSAYAFPSGRDGSPPAVEFTFNKAGGELFANLTRKNISERGEGSRESHHTRHLAIILDGMVMSAPTINSEIRHQGQISGNFTPQEVDSLVNILRSGALPGTLKATPVSETEVGPKAK